MNVRGEKEFIATFGDGNKKVAYAIVNTINATAKAVQAAEVKSVFGRFLVRKSQFIERQAAIIKPFASVSKGVFEARIAVGQKKNLLLPEYEAGAVRRGFKSGGNVAVPVVGGARPSARASVPEALYIKNLRLRKLGGRRSKGVSIGEHGTFAIQGRAILQEVPGPAKPRVLYAIVPRVRVPKMLGFVDTASRVRKSMFEALLKKNMLLEFSGRYVHAAQTS